MDVARTAEAHSVGAWSFMSAVFPRVKAQGYEDLVRERKREALELGWDGRAVLLVLTGQCGVREAEASR